MHGLCVYGDHLPNVTPSLPSYPSWSHQRRITAWRWPSHNKDGCATSVRGGCGDWTSLMLKLMLIQMLIVQTPVACQLPASWHHLIPPFCGIWTYSSRTRCSWNVAFSNVYSRTHLRLVETKISCAQSYCEPSKLWCALWWETGRYARPCQCMPTQLSL